MHSFGRTLRCRLSATRRLVATRRGIIGVDFALAAPLLILILIGLADFGRAWYDSMSLNMAARSAVEYARSNPYDTAGIQLAALSTGGVTSGASVKSDLFCTCRGPNPVLCTDMCPDLRAPLVYLSVTVTGPFHSLLPDLGLGVPSTISRSATLRVQ